MRTLVVETLIRAPREVVFDARTRGLRNVGDTKSYPRFHVRVTEMERPVRYVDEATHWAFRSLRHIHEFFDADGGTLMRDTLEFDSPFGAIAGWFLKRFVRRRASALDLEVR